MCGIAGIIQTDPAQFSKDHLKKMTDALAHRGPDGEGLWQNENGLCYWVTVGFLLLI